MKDRTKVDKKNKKMIIQYAYLNTSKESCILYIRMKSLKFAIPGPFLFIFKQTLQFLQQIYVINVHPLYGAGIRTHNLLDMSLLP